MTDNPRGITSSSEKQKALSRDLSDFLIELSIALHKHAMYPEGHPSLRPAAEAVVSRLAKILSERSTLSLGVARNQLVIEGVATDPRNPVLKDLAGRLHRHHLGAILFRAGVTPYEVLDMFKLVAEEADRSGKPLGLGPPEKLNAWANLRLYALTYERLEMVESGAPSDPGEDQVTRSRAAQLWIGLARAAIATDEIDGEQLEQDEIVKDPSVVAEAIRKNAGTTAYDQVIVGYMLQIAEELKTTGGSEALALKKRVSQVIRVLDQGTLSQLLTMGGDQTQRKRFLLNASEGMAVDAVVELVRAASRTEEQTISHSMLRLLRKLSHHAEASTGERGIVADRNVREQVSALIANWSLADPNPGAYGKALQQMSVANPIFAVAPEQMYKPEPRRLFEMALELDTVGAPVERAVSTLIEEGAADWVLEKIRNESAAAVSDAVWELLASKEQVQNILSHDPIDIQSLDILISKLGIRAAEPMLDVLVEAESRQTRRTLRDRLIQLGPEVGQLVLKLLNDDRWFVQRNLLGILADLPQLPEGFRGSDFLAHEDARVRREAYRIMFKDSEWRERSICRAIADSDTRSVSMALLAALDGCPPSALSLVASRALSGEDMELRVQAVRVLGASRHPDALPPILKIAEPRKKLLRTKLPPKTLLYLAALQALNHYPSDPRARKILAMAAASKDGEIARAAAGTETRTT